MPLNPENLRNAFFKKGTIDFQLNGLESFANALERDYYSSLYVTKLLTEKNECLLTLELTCNLTLAGLLFHFKKNEWGVAQSNRSPLSKLLDELEAKNTFSIDVDEFSIFLKDTAVIINRINTKSIPDQLHSIISKVGEHYVYLTRELGEMPFEIYVPVFESGDEDEDEDYDSSEDEMVFLDKNIEEYYHYWGLYFESEKDPIIYCLDDRSLLPGDLFVFP